MTLIKTELREDLQKIVDRILATNKPVLLIGDNFRELVSIARQVAASIELDENARKEVADLYTPIFGEPRYRAPFRAPHYTIGYFGVFGSRDLVFPGEIALAKHGVLLLDQIHDFQRSIIEDIKRRLDRGILGCRLIATLPTCVCVQDRRDDKCVCRESMKRRHQDRINWYQRFAEVIRVGEEK